MDLFDLSGRHPRRIIDRLRKQFPELTWHYEHHSRWVSSAGWAVQAYAALAPSYPDDDDTFRTEFRRTDTGEVVHP